MTGKCTTQGARIDYKGLRKVNPESARWAVIEYLKTNQSNISEADKTFGIQRMVIYDILKKKQEGNLKNRIYYDSYIWAVKPFVCQGTVSGSSCVGQDFLRTFYN